VLAYDEMTARGPVNSAVLPSRVHFFEPLVLTCRFGRWGIVARLANVDDHSPSAEINVAPSTGGVDPGIWGIRRIRN